MPQGSPIQTLYVDIQASVSKLKKQLAQAQQLTASSSKQMGRNFANLAAGTKQVNLETARLPSRLKLAATSFATLGATVSTMITRFSRLRNILVALTFGIGVAIGKAIANTNARFEDLRSTLDKVTKSSAAGKTALDFIRDFALKTPFDVENLTKAFIQLTTAGIQPTEKFLTSLGDAASVAAKPVEAFTSLVKIFARSTQGGLSTVDLDILNDKGIPVFSILRRELDITRGDIAEYGRTAEGAKEITDALLRGFDQQFGGSLASSGGNLSTVMSNLKEALDEIQLSFGHTSSLTGFTQSVKNLLGVFTELLSALKPFAAILGEIAATLVNTTAGAFWLLTKAIDAAGKSLSFLYDLAEKSGAITPEPTTLKQQKKYFDSERDRLTKSQDVHSQIFDPSFYGPEDNKIISQDLDKENEALNAYESFGRRIQAIFNTDNSETPPPSKSKEFKDTIKKLEEDAKIAQLSFSNLKSTQIEALRDAKLLDQLQIELIETVNGTVAKYTVADGEQGNVDEILAAEKRSRQFIKAAENNRNAIESIRSINNEISLLQATLRDPSGDEAAFLGFKGDIQYTDRQEGIAKQRFKEKRDLIKQIESEEKAQSALDDQLRKAQSTVKGLLNDETALEKTHRELTEAVREFGSLVIPGANEALEKMRQQIKEADPLFQSLVGSLQNVSSGISDAFADMIANAKFSFDGLRSVFASFVSQIISKAIELLFINRIINSIFGLTGSSALTTANLPFSTPAGGASAPIGGHPGVGLATGGSYSPDIPRIVGERGPEIIIPESAGRVINSNGTRSMLGGGDNIVVAPEIHITESDGTSGREFVDKMVELTVSETIAALNDAKRRNQSRASGI